MVCKAGVVEGEAGPARLEDRVRHLEVRQEGGEGRWRTGGGRRGLLLTGRGVIALGGAAVTLLRAGVAALYPHWDDPLRGGSGVGGDSDGDDSLLCPLTLHCITTVTSHGGDQLTGRANW